MNERRASLVLALLPSVAVLFAAAGFGLAWQIWGRPLRQAPMAKLGAALDTIQNRFYGEVAPEEAVDGALRGMVALLDPYCEYYTAEEWLEFHNVQLMGKFGGVGIVVEADPATGYLNIITPIEGTPAFAADLLPGDQIREVDGVSVKGLSLHEVVRRIKGEPGTTVRLTVVRKGKKPFVVPLVRALIEIQAVKARMLEEGIGYIRISDFTEMMGQFDAEIRKLRDQGLKALIIDLRFNHGGLLDQCVQLSGRFLEDGVIVSTRGRSSGDTRVLKAQKGDTLPSWPLVVLVNEATASASEIFAGAMKDRGRGTIVGSRTFGKGSVQTPFPLPDGSCLKVTTARYYTPGGVSVHREEGKKDFGIEPDHRVEMSLEEYDRLKAQWNAERIVKGEAPKGPEGFVDHQMEAGLEVIRAALAGRPARVEARVVQKDRPSEN